MSARVIQKMGQEADCTNHLLMHAVAANVSGQIASVVAGGVVLQYLPTIPSCDGVKGGHSNMEILRMLWK